MSDNYCIRCISQCIQLNWKCQKEGGKNLFEQNKILKTPIIKPERTSVWAQYTIRINNRNLKTLDISINNTISIFETLKEHKGPIISESGIKTETDAKYIYEKTGIKNFLIGESLLKSDNPAELLKKFTQIIQ